MPPSVLGETGVLFFPLFLSWPMIGGEVLEQIGLLVHLVIEYHMGRGDENGEGKEPLNTVYNLEVPEKLHTVESILRLSNVTLYKFSASGDLEGISKRNV